MLIKTHLGHLYWLDLETGKVCSYPAVGKHGYQKHFQAKQAEATGTCTGWGQSMVLICDVTWKKLRTHERKYFFSEITKISFVTALNLIYCHKQIKYQGLQVRTYN